MEKKEYQPPKMEVVEMPFGGRLLDASPIFDTPILVVDKGECKANCDDDDW